MLRVLAMSASQRERTIGEFLQYLLDNSVYAVRWQDFNKYLFKDAPSSNVQIILVVQQISLISYVIFFSEAKNIRI